MAGEQPSALSFEPVLRTIFLTLRAVAVATGVVRVVERPAVVTAVERAAEGRGATGDDVVHRPAVRGQHLLRVRQRIGRAGDPKDLRQLQHGATAVESNLPMGWGVSSAASGR